MPGPPHIEMGNGYPVHHDDQPESKVQRSPLANFDGEREAADREYQHRRIYEEATRGTDQIAQQRILKGRAGHQLGHI